MAKQSKEVESIAWLQPMTNRQRVAVRVAADVYDIEHWDIFPRDRRKTIVQARQLAMYLLRQAPHRLSYCEIGRILGRNHSTVLHGIGQLENAMKNNISIRIKVDEAAKAMRKNQGPCVSFVLAFFQSRPVDFLPGDQRPDDQCARLECRFRRDEHSRGDSNEIPKQPQ